MTHINTTHASRIYSALSDPLRIRILRLLLERELCVCEIERGLEITQSKASRHLHVLMRAGLLADRRDAVWVYYRIAENPSPQAKAALETLERLFAGKPGRDSGESRSEPEKQTAAAVFCSSEPGACCACPPPIKLEKI